MKNKKRIRWKKIPMVLALLIKKKPKKVDQFLVGRKVSGILKGYDAPPGGHVEPDDTGPFCACSRETEEESGYIPKKGKKVAMIMVDIVVTRTRRMITVIQYLEWEGRLKVDHTEYSELKFVPVNKLNKLNLAPGDLLWLEEVLHNKMLVKGKITCGKDRTKLMSAEIAEVERL